MAGRSQCSQCDAALESGANYCPECGTPQTLIVLDPLGLEDPPLIRQTNAAPHARLTMLAGLLFVFAMVAVLWGLSRESDPPNDEPLSSETPQEEVSGTDPATSTTTVVTTTASTTTASTTTGAETTGSEQLFVNNVQGPVLGDGVDGVLIHINVQTMRKIDLSTGAIEVIALEHPVLWSGPESGIVVNGKLVAIRGSVITITDLSDGSQRELIDAIDGLFEMHVAGRAGVDSVWLATYPEPDRTSGAIEVGLDGEIRHRVKIPQPFEIRWAEEDEFILGSPDGSFRYDTLTWATERMPGAVLAFEPGLVITTSCEESLQCDVLLDRGSGPQVVDWPSASELFNRSTEGPIDVSPDVSGALVHVYGQSGAEFSYIDLQTGSRVDLGEIGIDPYRGVVWVEGSRWIIGQDESSRMALAIDTETGTRVDLDLQLSGYRLSELSGRSVSFLAFIPSN